MLGCCNPKAPRGNVGAVAVKFDQAFDQAPVSFSMRFVTRPLMWSGITRIS
jgi:hypothetical protein